MSGELTSFRPTDEEFTEHVRDAMKDSANAISVAWLASECRRARYQEIQLAAAVEMLESG